MEVAAIINLHKAVYQAVRAMDLTLGGALLVALLAFTGTLIVAITQARGAKDARFAEQKRIIYTEFLLAADTHVQSLANQIAAVGEQLRAEGRIGPISPHGTSEDVERAFRGLVMVAPARVVEAARATGETVVTLDGHAVIAGQEQRRAAELWESDTDAYNAAREVFIDAARGDLGQKPLSEDVDA